MYSSTVHCECHRAVDVTVKSIAECIPLYSYGSSIKGKGLIVAFSSIIIRFELNSCSLQRVTRANLVLDDIFAETLNWLPIPLIVLKD